MKLEGFLLCCVGGCTRVVCRLYVFFFLSMDKPVHPCLAKGRICTNKECRPRVLSKADKSAREVKEQSGQRERRSRLKRAKFPQVCQVEGEGSEFERGGFLPSSELRMRVREAEAAVPSRLDFVWEGGREGRRVKTTDRERSRGWKGEVGHYFYETIQVICFTSNWYLLDFLQQK